MNRFIWDALGLRPVQLADIEEACGPFDPDAQPPRGALGVLALGLLDPAREMARTQQLVQDLRAQEPVERIVNTLLLSAIKGGAQRLTIEPDALGVRVLHTVGALEREHLHLPTTTLEPMLERLRRMAHFPTNARTGSFRLEVDSRRFLLHVGFERTVWGERVEIAFAAASGGAI